MSAEHSPCTVIMYSKSPVGHHYLGRSTDASGGRRRWGSELIHCYLQDVAFLKSTCLCSNALQTRLPCSVTETDPCRRPTSILHAAKQSCYFTVAHSANRGHQALERSALGQPKNG